MKITCIADLHGHLPKLDGGDILIIAGDITASDKIIEYCRYFDWLKKQKYKKIIVIGGNHDNLLAHTISTEECRNMGIFEGDDGLDHVEYLLDNGTLFEYEEEIETESGTKMIPRKLKIWGSPWTNWFRGINPKCKAFMGNEELLFSKWKMIPKDTDILITHGPPFGCMDKTYEGKYVGSKSLADALLKLKLKLHVFGHIHEGYGQQHQALSAKTPWDTHLEPIGHLSINCSLMNQYYQPVNKPVTIEI